MYDKWIILSSGNTDLLHAAVGNAIWIDVPNRNIERFDGTPDPRETLMRYLELKSKGPNTVDVVSSDATYMKRIERFYVTDEYMVRASIKWLKSESESNFDILVFPNKEIPYNNFPFVTGVNRRPIYRGNIDVEIEKCLLCVSKAGASMLLEALEKGTLPEMYFFRRAMVTQYQWRYGEGCYD